MFGWKRKQTPAYTPHTPAALAPAQASGNADELEMLKARMARRAGRGKALSPTPLLDLAGGAAELGEGALGSLTDLADLAGNSAISMHDALTGADPTMFDYDELGDLVEVPHEDGWDIGRNVSRFGAGGVGVGLDAIGVIKGVNGVQKSARDRKKATTQAGRMLANREIKDASLDTASSVLGLGGGVATMVAGQAPGLDAAGLLFDAGRHGVEGGVALGEARRLQTRDLTRAQRDADLGQVPLEAGDKGRRYRAERFVHPGWADKRAQLRKFKASREAWREGQMSDGDYATTYGALDDSQRADEIRRHLMQHKRRRGADELYQGAADVVDGAGSFTGGADFGAVKLAGKAMKLGRGGLNLGRKAVIRGERVHKLRQAKRQVNGEGGVEDKRRSPLWGARQFFVGNVEHQRAKLDAKASGGQFDQTLDTAGKLDGFRQLTVPRDERAARDLQEMATRTKGTDHERAVREAARKTALAAGVMSRGGYAKLEEEAAAKAAAAKALDPSADQELLEQQHLNAQLWDARDDRVGEKGANVGKLLLDRQFSR
jgi:hypothetical protein